MDLRQCILTNNDCYRRGTKITPTGVMVHSTGANNPNLRRYVQPDDGDLGRNPNGNDWNRPNLSVCVHAFIGKLADGTVATYQTLPWNMRGWHAGGRANDTHIAFEICEDGLDDAQYFATVYQEAVSLTAYLCQEYSLDPLRDGVVIDHAEGNARGIASNHGDVGHWFPRFGKSMDTFRRDVAEKLKEENSVTPDEFVQQMAQYRAGLQNNDAGLWSAEARTWAIDSGLIQGIGSLPNGAPNYAWRDFVTREELITLLYRFSQLP